MNVFVINSEAAAQIKKMNSENQQYFKVDLVQQGCSGFSYKMSYVDDFNELKEECILVNGIKVVIKMDQKDFLSGSELVWVKEGFSSRLQFVNPNVKQSCGCGLSVKF